MLQHAPKGVRIRLAGRTESKLARCAVNSDRARPVASDRRRRCGSRELLAALVRSTKVVASTVGRSVREIRPTPCSGLRRERDGLRRPHREVIFVPRVRGSVRHRTARLSGARIVNSCGFDSIPSDLVSVFLTFEAAAREGASGVTDTQLIWSPRSKVEPRWHHRFPAQSVGCRCRGSGHPQAARRSLRAQPRSASGPPMASDSRDGLLGRPGTTRICRCGRVHS